MAAVPAALILATLLAAAPAAASPRQGELASALEAVGPETSDASLEEIAAALGRRPRIVPDYLAAVSGATPEPAQARLLAALAPRLEPMEVLRALQDGLSTAPALPWRRAAVDLFALHAGATDLSELGRLVTDDQGLLLEDEELADRFEEAAETVLRREGALPTELRWLSEAVPALRERLVHAVGRSGAVEGLVHLRRELADAELAAAALIEIGRLAPAAPPDLARELAPDVRPFLEASGASQRRAAIRAVSGLGDVGAVALLLPFLEEERPSGERTMAHAALEALGGRKLPARADVWRGWYDAETRWLEEEAPALLDSLDADEDARVVAALQALSAHPLHRHALSRTLATRLADHPSAAVRAQLCRALGRLGSGEILFGLTQALGDEDESVRAEAHAALVAITGLELPPEAQAWRRELGS